MLSVLRGFSVIAGSVAVMKGLLVLVVFIMLMMLITGSLSQTKLRDPNSTPHHFHIHTRMNNGIFSLLPLASPHIAAKVVVRMRIKQTFHISCVRE